MHVILINPSVSDISLPNDRNLLVKREFSDIIADF